MNSPNGSIAVLDFDEFCSQVAAIPASKQEIVLLSAIYHCSPREIGVLRSRDSTFENYPGEVEDDADVLCEAINALPPFNRAAFVFRVIYDCSLSQIAILLRVSEHRAEHYVSEAMAIVEHHIANSGFDSGGRLQ